MRVIFWGQMLPKVVESVVSELSHEQQGSSRKLQICIQVDPSVRATEFASRYLDEVIRVDAFSFDALERKLVERRDPALLVLDIWGLLFAENIHKLMQDLRPAFNLARRTLVLMPRLWSGDWLSSPVLSALKRNQSGEFLPFFKRLVEAFEVLWNTDGPEIYCLQSSPTFELLEFATGRSGLNPSHFWGVSFLPKECRNFTARFSSVSRMTQEIIRFLSLPLPRIGERLEQESVVPWVRSLEADVLYGPVRSRSVLRAESSTSVLESVPEGFQIRTPLIEQGLFNVNCGWENYVRTDLVKKQFWALPPAVLARTGKVDFPSYRAASWFYFLALLEHFLVSETEQLEQGRQEIRMKAFPSVFENHHIVQADEGVLG
jgi:hypothetical protein